ncbi:protein kinase [Aggregicoccus sp. 17bor-14]|nr:protein kinase [Simulacricoccus sp. 17bor-14]MRI89491.1 protein kinase [Aggregicoccus sp. 17bor-14]
MHSFTTELPGGSGGFVDEVAGSRPTMVGAQLGSFRLVRLLGQGGMGSVYLGEHTAIGSRVAVKVLHRHLASDPQLVARFYAEARAVNLIGHENIVSIYDLCADRERPYLIMEYLEGQSLAQLLERGALDVEVLVPVLAQICDALQAAHLQGIVHRDLKPENIFLTRRGRDERFVKVLDFGIAKLYHRATRARTSVGLVVGTPEYMAPEQSTAGEVDGRADLYALGVMAFQLATGRLPFEAGGLTGQLLAHQTQAPPNPSDVSPRVPRAFSEVVLRALAKRPEDRYPDAAAMRAALEASLAAAPPPARAPAPPPPPVAAPPPPPARAFQPVPARVRLPGVAAPVRMRCTELSRGGLFLATDASLPPLHARVEVTLELASTELPLTGEVVRHVPPEQSKAWGMAPGFALQLVEATPALRAAIGLLLKGDAPPPPPPAAPEPAEDAALAAALEPYRRRGGSDPYVLLALPQDASQDAVRARAREARGELEALLKRPLPAAQRAAAEATLARVREAGEQLGNAERRALHDAQRGNHRGVAACIAAGLTVTRLEALRGEHLAASPAAAGRAHVLLLTGQAFEKDGQAARALESYERALALDPLHLELQQRYRALKRQLAARGSA